MEEMFKNGNRTHAMLEKNWELYPWICLKMGIEPMNMLRVWIETIQLFEYGNRTKNLFKCEMEILSKFSKGTRTHAYVYDNQILLYFFFIIIFYTLVLVVMILNFWWMAKGAYEAGHCLHGHHEFGWISLHRWMRSV